MAGSVNKVILVGNLGRDPEVRTMQNGNKIVNLNIATSETWKDRQSGEKKERTEWHRVVIFAPGLADVAERYLRKGSSVYLEGQLQTRKWQDQNGQDRYSTEVVLQPFKSALVLLGSPGDGQRNSGGSGQGSGYGGHHDEGGYDQGGGYGTSRGGGGNGGFNPPPNDLDDEIPFITCTDDAVFFGRKAVI